MNTVHYSSKSNEWETPPDFFAMLNAEFFFTLDPCSTHDNARCPKHYTKAENGLAQSWDGETVFMNPPYKREIGPWMRKAAEAFATVVCLVPARTDTIWWHQFAMRADEIRFVRGRLQFVGAAFGAPFPSAVIIFKNRLDGQRGLNVPIMGAIPMNYPASPAWRKSLRTSQGEERVP